MKVSGEQLYTATATCFTSLSATLSRFHEATFTPEESVESVLCQLTALRAGYLSMVDILKGLEGVEELLDSVEAGARKICDDLNSVEARKEAARALSEDQSGT